jgi:hypothetical protein
MINRPDESGHAREGCPAMSSADLASGAPHPCAQAARETITHIEVDSGTLTGRVTGYSRAGGGGDWTADLMPRPMVAEVHKDWPGLTEGVLPAWITSPMA